MGPWCRSSMVHGPKSKRWPSARSRRNPGRPGPQPPRRSRFMPGPSAISRGFARRHNSVTWPRSRRTGEGRRRPERWWPLRMVPPGSRTSSRCSVPMPCASSTFRTPPSTWHRRHTPPSGTVASRRRPGSTSSVMNSSMVTRTGCWPRSPSFPSATAAAATDVCPGPHLSPHTPGTTRLCHLPGGGLSHW